MLEFYIQDIPEEFSTQTLDLDPEDLEIDPHTFKGGTIDLEFYRTLHHIRVNFTITTDVELTCDRSLEPFDHHIEADYEVLFKVDVQEEKEDEKGAVRRFNFDSNTINIEDEVRDTILLNIPVKKVHPKFVDEDGRIKEFEDKKFGTPDGEEAEEEPIDPRWQKLKELKSDN